MTPEELSLVDFLETVSFDKKIDWRSRPDLGEDEYEDLRALDFNPEQKVLAGRKETTPLHAAADAHVAKLSVALRYAFAMARRALKPVLASIRAAGFNEDQPRDESGRWTEGGESGARYYRGTTPGDTRRIKTGNPAHDEHLFVTDQAKNAKWYGEQIEQVDLVPGAKILKEGTREFQKIAGKGRSQSMLDWSSNTITKAKAAGYDVIHFTRQTDIGTVVLNPKAIKSRSVTTLAAMRTLGGPGSGNFGHAGRPGAVGGSAPISMSGALRSKLQTTSSVNDTSFVLPDGTRLTHSQKSHEDALLAVVRDDPTLQSVDVWEEFYKEGIIRYSDFGGGVQLGKPLTENQAQLIADDWNYYYKKDLFLDITHPGGKILAAERFTYPMTADVLRRWSKVEYEKSLKTLGSPDQPRDEQGQWTSRGGGSPEASADRLLKQHDRVKEHAGRMPNPSESASSNYVKQLEELHADLERHIKQFPLADEWDYEQKDVALYLKRANSSLVEGRLDAALSQMHQVAAILTIFGKEKRYKALASLSPESIATDAMREALDAVLAPTLLKVVAAGGNVALDALREFIEVKDKKGWRALGELRAAAPKLKIRFDAKNPHVIDWAAKHAAELIDDITETTRKRIRIAIEELQEDGDWEFAHDRILHAVGDEDRADLIARHETMLAAGEGQRQGWDQAVEEGLLTGDERRVWIVTPDDKLCPICIELEDKTAPLGGKYSGGIDGPPAHVACRCTEGII